MAKINRKYIDKHWIIYILRGGLAGVFGLLMLFNCLTETSSIALPIGVFLLGMGAIDSVTAIYSANKKHGWINAIADAMVDVVAALVLLFLGRDSLVTSVIVLAVYTLCSGLIDVVHGFLSTVDPTDRFIRILIGVLGCVIGIVLLNTGAFDVNEFYRFFGVYVIMVGVTSLIYGVHNREQMVEAKEMLREMAHERAEMKAELAAKRPSFWERLIGASGAKSEKPKVEAKMPEKKGREEAKRGHEERERDHEHDHGHEHERDHDGSKEK